jgi:hypothetical protein
MDCEQVDSAAADGMEPQLGLGNDLQESGLMCIERCSAKDGQTLSNNIHPKDQISDEMKNEMKDYADIIKQLRDQPIEVAIDWLFVQGGFKKFTEVYGEHDGHYFQSLCTSLDSVEDYKWIESIYVGRCILTLAHPAHAVFLFQKQNPLVPPSVQAWAVAKRCHLDPEILDMSFVMQTMQRFCPKDGAIFHDTAPLIQFHETRSAEGWQYFTTGLIFHYIWWHQNESPWVEDWTMQTATVALAKEEERIAYRNSDGGGVVLKTVKAFFENYGSQYCDQPEVIRNFVALVTHYPNLKWRLARILHSAAEKAGLSAERIEALRYKYGHKQYKQNYFAWKRTLARESDKAKRLCAEMGEKLLLPFRTELSTGI